MIALDQSLRILKEQGCGPDERGAFTCPRCREAALTIINNGGGPEYECAAGCDAVGGFLEAIAAIPRPAGEHIDSLEVLRGKLELPELERIVKHGRLGAGYDLHLTGRSEPVTIGSAAVLASQAKFRVAFFPQVRRSPPRHKTADWDEVVDLVEKLAEERDTVATLDEETLSWIAGALGHGQPPRNVDTGNAQQVYELLAPGVNGRPPFYDVEGRLHLRLEHLTTWLGRMAGVRVTQPELSARLSAIDFERVQVAARSGDKTRKARYWVSPTGIEERL